MEVITIYTDGSGYYKNGLGGIGVYVVGTGQKISKGYENTTTSRMEIMAVLTAIKLIKNKECRVIIKCDNQYVVKAIREGWMFKWEHENWENRKNSDLWKQILKEIRARDKVKFRLEWVRGHQSGDGEDEKYNNLVDELANYKQFTKREKDLI